MITYKDIVNYLYKEDNAQDKRESEFNALYERLDVVSIHEAVSKIYDVDRFLRKHGGISNLDIVLSDLEVSAAWEKRQTALMGTTLKIESDYPELKQFFEDQLLPHEDQLKEDFQMAVAHGFNVQQIIYDEDRSGRVKGFRREDFWRFMPLPDLKRVLLNVATSEATRGKQRQVLPYGKWVLTTYKASSSNPIGDALFKKIYVYWAWKCLGFENWAKFINRYASGFLIGKTPDPKQVIELRKALDQALQGASIAVTSQDDVSLLNMTSNGDVFKKFDDQIINAIYRATLGETQTSIMEQRGGSQSANAHNQVRLEKTASDAKLVQKAFNETIKQIALVNNIDLTERPVKARVILNQGLEADRAKRDTDLKNQGVSFTKKYYQRHYGFEDDEIEDAIDLGFSATSSINLQEGRAKSRRVKNGISKVDEVVDLLSKGDLTPLDNDDVIAAMRSVDSVDELREKLTTLYAQDNTEFAEEVAKALYHVAILGAEDAAEKK